MGKAQKNGFSIVRIIVVIAVITILGGGYLLFFRPNIVRLSPSALASCESLNKSEQEIQKATVYALEKLSIAGRVNPWGDPKQFEELLKLIEEKLGCSISKKNLQTLNP